MIFIPPAAGGDMRKSTIYFSFLIVLFLLSGSIFFLSSAQRRNAASDLEEMGRTVKELELTDLSLFMEARYTRHPSQSDLQTAFQDHPMAMEHFPSGSLMKVPEVMRESSRYETLDR